MGCDVLLIWESDIWLNSIMFIIKTLGKVLLGIERSNEACDSRNEKHSTVEDEL